ncbi:MAG: DUF4157 domain-containing protein, partial [Spirulina sp. SIO3F2]|nr:DUF4157 domain-containing protein [Spirulina sp. SIO3F2]
VLLRSAGLTPSEPSATAALPLQPRLTIGQVNDPYEQEADRVARQVVNQIQCPQMQAQAIAPIADLQAKGNLEGGTVSSDVERGINQARGGGQPLSAKTQSQMGGAIGADFSQVRVHTSNHADQLNQAVQARAFTTGPDIFFKKGEYNPGSRGGQELLAHELTHVVQQGAAVQCKPSQEKTVEQLAKTLQPQRFGLPESGNVTEESPKGQRSERAMQLKALSGKPTAWMQPIQLKELVQRVDDDVTVVSSDNDQANAASGGDAANANQLPPATGGEAVEFPIYESGSFGDGENDLEAIFAIAKPSIINEIRKSIPMYREDDLSSENPADYPERRDYYNTSKITYIQFVKTPESLDIIACPLLARNTAFSTLLDNIINKLKDSANKVLGSRDSFFTNANSTKLEPKPVEARRGGGDGTSYTTDYTFLGRFKLDASQPEARDEKDYLDANDKSSKPKMSAKDKKKAKKKAKALSNVSINESGEFTKIHDPEKGSELVKEIVGKLAVAIGTFPGRTRIEVNKSDKQSSIKLIDAKNSDLGIMDISKIFTPLFNSYEGIRIDIPSFKKNEQAGKNGQKTYDYTYEFHVFDNAAFIEGVRDVKTAVAGAGSASEQSTSIEMAAQDLSEDDANTIYSKLEEMIAVFKEEDVDVVDVITLIFTEGLKSLLPFAMVIKRFDDIRNYRKRQKGLEESLENSQKREIEPGASESVGADKSKLQEGIGYAIEKVKKLIGNTLVKAISSLVQAVSRIFTLCFAAIFPPAAIASLCADLAAMAAKAVNFLYRKGKGIVKQLAGTRGKKRKESAESIFSSAIAGDPDALDAIRALNIKTIFTKVKNVATRLIVKAPGAGFFQFLAGRDDKRYLKISQAISGSTGGSSWNQRNVHNVLMPAANQDLFLKQGIFNLLNEKGVNIQDPKIAEMGNETMSAVITKITPQELLANIEQTILNRSMSKVDDENLLVYLQGFDQNTSLRKAFVSGLAELMKSSDVT